MIGRIRGEVIEDGVIMTPGGVGYNVTTAHPLEVGSSVDLRVYSVWRETSVSLYGFRTVPDMDLFKALLKAPGVGASTAMAVLATLGVQGTIQAFKSRDVAALQKVPGVGSKSAQKLLAAVDLSGVGIPENVAEDPRRRSGAVLDTIAEALKALGYTGTEIDRTIERVDPSLDENAALAAALKYLQS